jgi:three-Cys-motif partner protein
MAAAKNPQYLIASDGLRARVLGPRTLDKLNYIQKYCQAFMSAMAPKRAEGKWDKLVYLDLLCGPGLCIDRTGKQEHDGSPLRALKVRPAFDHLYCSDKSSLNITALKKRIPSEDKPRLTVREGDCNTLVSSFLSEVTNRSLGLALLDPVGFEVHFSTLQALAAKRMDLIYLFPSGIGIARNLGRFIQESGNAMDLFWGSDWRDLPAAKLASGKMLSEQEIQRFDPIWVKSFREKMAGLGYTYQDEDAPLMLNAKESLLYHLLFFSHHKAGLKLWKAIKQIDPDGQRLFHFPES